MTNRYLRRLAFPWWNQALLLREVGGRFHRCEVGAGYSLSVVLLVPIYIAYMAFVVEAALLTNSQQALTRSMRTSSHAVEAWVSHRDALERDGQTLEMMVHACTARTLLAYATTHVTDATRTDNDFKQSLQDSGMHAFAAERYAMKLSFVRENLRVRLTPLRRTTEGILVQAEYDTPLWMPWLSAIFATGQGNSGYFRTVTSEVWVPLFTDEIEQTNLGIPYSPLQADTW